MSLSLKKSRVHFGINKVKLPFLVIVNFSCPILYIPHAWKYSEHRIKFRFVRRVFYLLTSFMEKFSSKNDKRPLIATHDSQHLLCIRFIIIAEQLETKVSMIRALTGSRYNRCIIIHICNARTYSENTFVWCIVWSLFMLIFIQ